MAALDRGLRDPVPPRCDAITGENSGPGAVFHSLRSIRTILSISDDVRHLTDAFLVNLTNPLSRVALAIHNRPPPSER